MTKEELREQTIQNLLAAIAHMETQRTTLGDAVVDASIAALRQQLAALQPVPPSKQQRKQVTVLFADVSGFTAMSETMDPEDMTEIMNALWARLDQAITDHTGHIDKHMGDGVMAIWGVETAREDDPERAIRAALSMQAGLAAFCGERQMDLAMRIGIHTGPVLLGKVGTTGEYTAMGDTVNLASRLEEAAPAGDVLISHDTYRLVRGVFEVQALMPLQVKGKSEPVRVYRVQQAKPHTFRMSARGIEGIETHMIGRSEELTHLQQALRDVIEQRQVRMVTIVGEAGIGKSRLLYEFENWAELLPEEFFYFKGRARQETQNQPYALFRDLFVFRLQVQESDSQHAARAKLEAGLGEMLGDDPRARMQAHFIGHVLGFDFSDSPHLADVLPGKGRAPDPQQLRDRAILYLTSYFRNAAAEDPVLVLLEDYHWADDSSLDLVQHLAQALQDEPLLIIGLARPSIFEQRPDWGQGRPYHQRLDLQTLSQEESRQLVADILRKLEAVPPVLERVVLDKAGGNPFYVEELIKMLIEDGVIEKGTPYWRVEPARLAKVQVPQTLTGILQARLDSLPQLERKLLQHASVVGRIFWEAVVAYLGTERLAPSADDSTSVPALIEAICARELAFPRRTSAFAQTREYIFKHAILRDVTYESVLKKERRAYHALVAEWLLEQSGARAHEYIGLIADHLDLAGQTEQAITHLQRAAEQAATQFAHTETLHYLGRALDLSAETDYTRRYNLLLARETIYDLQGEREAQLLDLLTLAELAELSTESKLTASLQKAGVALRRAHYGEMTGDYPQAISSAREGIEFARVAAELQEADPTQGPSEQALELEATGHLRWGQALARQGNYAEAQQQLEKALSLARRTDIHQVEAHSLRTLGALCWYQDDYAGATDYFEQALALYREIGDRRGVARTLGNLGVVPWTVGNYAKATAYFQQALRIHREIGDLSGEAVAYNNMGIVTLVQGYYEEAQRYYEQALHLQQVVEDREGEEMSLNNLGVAARAIGNYAAAKDYFERALCISRAIGIRRGQAVTLSNLGLILHNMGDDESAESYCRQALEIAQELGLRDLESESLTNLGHALDSKGDLEGAADVYRRAVALRQELEQSAMMMESVAGLAWVILRQGKGAEALSLIEEILQYLETETLEGAEEPFRVHQACYQILRVIDDPRAQQLLHAAHRHLQEQAAKIETEESRRMFLENVPPHRAIVEAFRQSYGD